MLTMEHIYHIRHEYNNKGKSIRKISKETGHAWETVTAYVEQENLQLTIWLHRTREKYKQLGLVSCLGNEITLYWKNAWICYNQDWKCLKEWLGWV